MTNLRYLYHILFGEFLVLKILNIGGNYPKQYYIRVIKIIDLSIVPNKMNYQYTMASTQLTVGYFCYCLHLVSRYNIVFKNLINQVPNEPIE